MLVLGAQFMIPAAPPPVDLVTRAPRRPRPVTIPALPDYPAILRAPLFASDRQPAAATAGATGGATPEGSLDAYAALGGATGGGVATVVVSGPSMPAKVIKPGDELAGWRLVAVDHTGATFMRDGRRHTLIIGAPAEGAAPAQGTQP